MRLLLTASGGSGHVQPLIPLASAAASAGHDVAFAVRPWMVASLDPHGFEAFAAGSDIGLAPETRPLVPVDRERELRDLVDGFGGRIARERAAGLLAIAEEWGPDLIVWDETDFAAPVVAERLGLPHAAFVVSAAGSFVRPELLAPVLDELRVAHGLAHDPSASMLSRSLVLSPVPPAFRDPAFPPPGTLRPIRPWRAPEPPAWSRRQGRPRSAWASRNPGAPAIYVTFGTVFNHESGDLFERAVAGLARLGANLLVTVGREIDPAQLGSQPAHVTVERFIASAEVLPHADLVVCHAGSGTVLAAIAHGLPILALPMGADQPLNGDRIEALGLGGCLDVTTASSQDIADAASDLLADDRAYQVAAELRAEMARMPSPHEVLHRFEALVSAHTA